MIFAIDPGPQQSAALVWNGSVVFKPEILANSVLLERLRSGSPMGADSLAVEMIACYGMPVGAETFETCLVIGRILEIWERRSLPYRLVYRRDVKMHLCGTMKAKDPHIRQALIDRFGKVGTKKTPGALFGVSSHLWAALGVAVTAKETRATLLQPSAPPTKHPTHQGIN